MSLVTVPQSKKLDIKSKNFVTDESSLEHTAAFIVKSAEHYEGEFSSHGNKVSHDYFKEIFGTTYLAVNILTRPIDIPRELRVRSMQMDMKHDVDKALFPSFTKVNDMNLRINITGSSGSGKSFFAGMTLALLRLRQPGKKVFIISHVEEDNAYDLHNPIRIPIYNVDEEQKYSFSQLKSEHFTNSIVVFDDIDAHPEKDMRKIAINLRNSILKAGRHNKIDVVSVSHEILDYAESRMLLTESTHYVFFPNNDMVKIKRYFEYKQSYKRDELALFEDLFGGFENGRWLLYHKNVPKFFLNQREIRLEQDFLDRARQLRGGKRKISSVE